MLLYIGEMAKKHKDTNGASAPSNGDTGSSSSVGSSGSGSSGSIPSGSSGSGSVGSSGSIPTGSGFPASDLSGPVANSRMIRFVDRPGQQPEKRQANQRRDDWQEIYQEYNPAQAADQAARCSQCGVPFCQVHCPLENNIPDWLMLAANGRHKEAYLASQITNNFPEICGRICPQDRLCEGNCVVEQSGHGTVTIGAVERYLTDLAWEKGWVPSLSPQVETGASVGIVGAGPAGLAAAGMLRQAGVGVTLYDRQDRAGGLMVYGIPNFKLEKEIVARRVEQLKQAGAEFRLNCEVGHDLTLEDLRKQHDRILLAQGCYQARELKAPGVGTAGVIAALDFLIAANRAGFGEAVAGHTDGSLLATGKRVLVIGGGDTAMDCVRTAVRQGAKSVQCLYRRDEQNMPGSRREIASAREEGVEFIFQAQPVAFDGSASVERAVVREMVAGAVGADGRKQFVEGKQEINYTADLVILALGFTAESVAGLGVETPACTPWGTVQAQFPELVSSLPDVFAAGDIVRGASLVVWAVRDGRDAAAGILNSLAVKQETTPEAKAGESVGRSSRKASAKPASPSAQAEAQAV